MACIKLPSGECTLPWIMVSGLKWGDIIADYALFLMINYLTNTWGLGFAHAAGIINTFCGITKILEISFAFMADACLGIFKMLLLSSVAYSIGLAFLSMSTPPVLSNFAGNCSRYEAECVGPVQKALFFTSLVLMGVGMAGHAVSLDAFLRHHQTRDDSNGVNEEEADDDEKKEDKFWSVNNLMVMGISGIAALALSNIEPWEIKFAVPAIFSFAATLVFFAGKALGLYSNYGDKPKGSGLTTVMRVFVAAMFKCHQPLPKYPEDLYNGNDNSDSAQQLPHTDRCRCLDKAAIILPKKSNGGVDKVEENRWKLCTVTEVEETKFSFLTSIMWISYTVCGLVSSIGNTFFVVQAAKMNHNVGKWKVPSTVLLVLAKAAKYALVASLKSNNNEEKEQPGNSSKAVKNKATLDATGLAVFHSVLCCLTAALVEKKRRKSAISNHQSKISIFWLIPQFFFLISGDWYFEQHVNDFFKNYLTASIKRYAVYLTHFVWGIGQAFSLVSVLACKKWFSNDLDQSLLDNYYWTLTALSAVFFFWYCLVGEGYHKRFMKMLNHSANQPTAPTD